MTVKVVCVKEAGSYSDAHVSGGTVDVTLQRGKLQVTCEGIFIWDDEMADDDTFDMWAECAENGEEGYTVTIV